MEPVYAVELQVPDTALKMHTRYSVCAAAHWMRWTLKALS